MRKLIGFTLVKILIVIGIIAILSIVGLGFYINQQKAKIFKCEDPITFIYKGEEVIYGTVESQGKCWLDRNLGASQVATAYNDSLAYGNLFQWGRLDDGHQIRTSGTTTVLSSDDIPGHNNFIISKDIESLLHNRYDRIIAASYYYDWRFPKNDNLWQGDKGINNPCPSGWRVPTRQEWQVEFDSWRYPEKGPEQWLYPEKRIDARPYAMNSTLKLPAGGYRAGKDGLLDDEGEKGYYWSSNVSGVDAINLDFYNASIFIGNYFRVYGFSVRCIKD